MRVGRDQVKRRGSRCWSVGQMVVWREGLGRRERVRERKVSKVIVWLVAWRRRVRAVVIASMNGILHICMFKSHTDIHNNTALATSSSLHL